MMQQALVTGSNGFIGRRLVADLQATGMHVRCAVRSTTVVPGVPNVVAIGSIGPATDWMSAVQGADVVFHIAGVAQLARSDAPNVFDLVNAEGTRVLAEAAASAGAKRFILLSTIGVNGTKSNNKPFTEDDEANPASPYAASKLAAEKYVCEIAGRSNMEWSIVRAPMVYGTAAPGNFSRLVELVAKRWPLPLGAAVAKKSFISVDNLASILVRMASHPNAANGVWLVSDGEDVSTADLVRNIGLALGRPARLVFVPQGIMRRVAAIAGKERDMDSLFNPLQLDSSRVRERLGWTPPLRFAEAIERAVGRK